MKLLRSLVSGVVYTFKRFGYYSKQYIKYGSTRKTKYLNHNSLISQLRK